MILDLDLEIIGKVVKTHGIKGELNCIFEDDFYPEKINYIIIKTDGINVPFFIESIRHRNKDSYLIKLNGINSDIEASYFTMKDIFILKCIYKEIYDNIKDDDNVYIKDLIGYTILDNGNTIGRITDIEDSTENILFIVENENKLIYIPVAEDLILEINNNDKKIIMSLPEGLTDI